MAMEGEIINQFYNTRYFVGVRKDQVDQNFYVRVLDINGNQVSEEYVAGVEQLVDSARGLAYLRIVELINRDNRVHH